MLVFGATQIVVSQIPDFHNMQWLSVIAAIMSFAYSFIGLGLGFAKVIGNSSIRKTQHYVRQYTEERKNTSIESGDALLVCKNFE
jgi:hypothetical protein